MWVVVSEKPYGIDTKLTTLTRRKRVFVIYMFKNARIGQKGSNYSILEHTS